ncbi:signal recognition particle SRP9/SRP14 subunit [Hymenopellis radicata]|nr:signal recognition particle SRP9/SRP14 subunit [Hymenopellis radicata]
MQLVDSDTFLKHLQKLFESSQQQGSIWLTHKRLVHDASVKESDDDSREYPCLVRLTDGGKFKYSTRVMSSQLQSFYASYGALLKTSMSGSLRKRDKKREKQRAEQIAKRKKKLEEPIVVEGKKRGNGRRKRQRRMKAAVKQQEAIQKQKDRDEAKARS